MRVAADTEASVSAATPLAGRLRALSLTPELHHVLRRGAFLALHDVELDPLTLGQALEALTLNRRMMDEAVLLTVLGGDKAEALRIIEPLDRAGGACHVLLLACCCNRSPAMPPHRLRKRVI